MPVILRAFEIEILQKYQPKFQSHYVTYELPEDDMYVVQDPAIQAKPTIHQFVPIRHNYNKDGENKPWNYVTLKELHGYLSLHQIISVIFL